MPDKCYTGMRPGSATHTPVPDIVNDPASHVALMDNLMQAYHLSVSLRVNEERGVVLAIVERHTAEGASIGQALCRAAWLVVEAEEGL